MPALHGQLADLPNKRENLFQSPLHGIILTIFQNAKNGRKKTGNLFLISCLGVPFYVAAVIQFLAGYNSTNWNSDKTLFIAFNNCYILSSKSPQTLENAKFIASEFALRLSLVLYPFPSCYEPS